MVWAASFPNWGVAGLAWIAPGLLLLAALGAEGRSAFRLGYVGGTVQSLIGLYWMLKIPVAFFPILGWLVLSLFLGLYSGAWTSFCTWAVPGSPASREGGALVRSAMRRFEGTTWARRLGWTLMTAAAWVAWEMIQARLFSGFPWNLLGASQYRMLLLTQTASWAGVYGVSFLVVWGSASLLLAALRLLADPERRNAWQREVALPFMALLGVCGWGWLRVVHPPVPGPTARIALVQPSVPQTMIWNDAESGSRFARLLQLSHQALAAKPDLLVWPEAAVPYPVRYDTATSDAIADLLRGGTAWLALGSDDARVSVDAAGRRTTNYFNSAFLVSPQGRIVGEYAKRQLVIFGEYVPLAHWLPFLKWFTPISGGFTAGTRRVAFEVEQPRMRFAPLICFEDMFAGVVRDQCQEEIQFLLNMTNDGWFGESAQQWQHAANASLRAIENGLPLVRCSNNGITCWVDPTGRILGLDAPGFETPYAEGIKHISVPLRPPGDAWTVYRRHGDVFGWTCVAVTTAMAVAGRSRRTPDGARTGRAEPT